MIFFPTVVPSELLSPNPVFQSHTRTGAGAERPQEEKAMGGFLHDPPTPAGRGRQRQYAGAPRPAAQERGTPRPLGTVGGTGAW